MTLATINFMDGELVYADIENLSFADPILTATILNIDDNGIRGVFPLSAIRQVVLGETEIKAGSKIQEQWDKAVFRFIDGQLFRAFISPDSKLERHGGIWNCVEPVSHQLSTIGIPYAALKGVFKVKQWDSRTAIERNDQSNSLADRSSRLSRILAEREISKNNKASLWDRVNQ